MRKGCLHLQVFYLRARRFARLILICLKNSVSAQKKENVTTVIIEKYMIKLMRHELHIMYTTGGSRIVGE